MGCKDTVLPDPLMKNHSVKCLTFEENTRKLYNDTLCVFRALALHLRGKGEVRVGDFQIIQSIPEKTGGIDPANFRRACREDIARREDIVQADSFLYDFDIVDGSMIGELGRRSVEKLSNTVRPLRYNSHICYVFNINNPFGAYRCPSCDEFISIELQDWSII